MAHEDQSSQTSAQAPAQIPLVQGGTVDFEAVVAAMQEKYGQTLELLLLPESSPQEQEQALEQAYAEETAALAPQEAPSTEGLSSGELLERVLAGEVQLEGITGGGGGDVTGADDLRFDQFQLRGRAEEEAGQRAKTIFDVLQQSVQNGPTSFNLGPGIGEFETNQFSLNNLFGGGSDDFSQFKSSIINPPLESAGSSINPPLNRIRPPFSDPNGPQVPSDFNSVQRSSAGGLNFGLAGNHLKTIRDILGI